MRDTATLKSEHKKRLRLLEHQKRALESEQAQFKAGLQALTNGLRTTSGQDLAELQQQQRLLLARIAQIGDSLADVAKESDQIKLEQEWRTQVTKLLSSLKVDGRVSLQLSIEIDGQQVVIAAPQFE